ncbi:MAG: hypothetical protein A2X18_07545 [Bacteroidetes bacterium GWF2_40_14]|nr:MAG: hypothetical protein A2X18_07545 [Bacteroidetes bacterium GWF2_40_14]
MKTETLQQAKELEKQIKELKEHYEYIKMDKPDPYDGLSRIYVESRYSSANKGLKKEYLPISIAEYVELYLARVDKEIKRLEKELEKL